MAKSTMKDFGHDKKSFANLPQDVTMKEFSKISHENSELDDTIEGIDETIDKSVGKSKKHLSNQH